jgi:hypothetical protein
MAPEHASSRYVLCASFLPEAAVVSGRPCTRGKKKGKLRIRETVWRLLSQTRCRTVPKG